MTSTKGDGERMIHDWHRCFVAEAPQKIVGPGFEPGRWSFLSCRHFSEKWIPGIITALATPAHTELPTQA